MALNHQQIAVLATEHNFLQGIYAIGGIGCVVDEVSEAFLEKNRDIRCFLPYHSFDDSKGRIYVLKDKRKTASCFDDFKLVSSSYSIKANESFALISKSADHRKIDKYFLLKDTKISGHISRMRTDKFSMEKIPYRLFEVETTNKGNKIYLIYTPLQAKSTEAYGIFRMFKPVENYFLYANFKKKKSALIEDVIVKDACSGDFSYTEFQRAFKDILQKMNSKKFDYFTPKNIWLHDRFGSVFCRDIYHEILNDNEYAKNIKVDFRFHNTGRSGYQGVYLNPIDFFRIFASESDLKKLKKSEIDILKRADKKIKTKGIKGHELLEIRTILSPFIDELSDDYSAYNMSVAPFLLADVSDKMSIGTVSENYGREMEDKNLIEFGEGLKSFVKKHHTKMLHVINGSRSSNMQTNNKLGFWGSGKLNQIFIKNYTPYDATLPLKSIFKIKEKNKELFLNSLASASSGKDGIADMFFSPTKKESLRAGKKLELSLGKISSYQKADILFMSWGRPDAQKGFALLLRAFRKVFSSNKLTTKQKEHIKLVAGAGGGNSRFAPPLTEWKLIKDEMKKISKIRNGHFKKNVCYINGLFPNRFVTCADLAVFTSRYEPCGITPFESFACGTPVLATKTGGLADIVKENTTGFLTKTAFLIPIKGIDSSFLPPERLNDKTYLKRLSLLQEEKRMEKMSDQIADIIINYMKKTTSADFEKYQQKLIKNAFNQKTEWNNNTDITGQKPSIDIYDEQIFG